MYETTVFAIDPASVANAHFVALVMFGVVSLVCLGAVIAAAIGLPTIVVAALEARHARPQMATTSVHSGYRNPTRIVGVARRRHRKRGRSDASLARLQKVHPGPFRVMTYRSGGSHLTAEMPPTGDELGETCERQKSANSGRTQTRTFSRMVLFCALDRRRPATNSLRRIMPAEFEDFAAASC
jgi:hypothetical protein